MIAEDFQGSVPTDDEYTFRFPRRWHRFLKGGRERMPDMARMHAHTVISREQMDATKVPLDANEAVMENIAQGLAQEVFSYWDKNRNKIDLVLDGIGLLCFRMGIREPQAASDEGTIARAVSRAWWARNLRVEHKRRFEHISILLGMTGLKNDPYISRESAARQEKYNRDNQHMLESVIVENDQGDKYALAELAALGTANKSIRRGELMLRIRGCEEIAVELKHVGVFLTITCPSKYHSVGGTNKKFNGATPRDAQAYLCKVWSRIRTALGRERIHPYGFRIAEPHSDGCPHWHLLVFVEPEKLERFQSIFTKYALNEDYGEWESEENRVKIVRIEAGKGTAAGYIAKYVSKNIDGHGVGDHKAFENGTTYVITDDLFGNQELTPSQRVTYWSQNWNIRQFQSVGCAPVGVWRELRRVQEETVRMAPEEIKRAWRACQKIETADMAANKQADFAEYMRVQGGPNCGAKVAIRLAKRMEMMDGRYETYEAEKLVGVVLQSMPDGVYESKRYQWKVIADERQESRAIREFFSQLRQLGARTVDLSPVPWTGVNNCTGAQLTELGKKLSYCTKRLVDESKLQKIKVPIWIDWPEIKRKYRAMEQETKNFASQMDGHRQ